MVSCGGKVYKSFEELGDDILRSLPKKRQRVKWWRLHRPSPSYYRNCMCKTWYKKLFNWLPHWTTSGSHVGYFFLHLFLFNRYSILFHWGHWERSKT